MKPSSHAARLGTLLVALLVLVSSSASFHGYLLQPSCERGAEECRPHAEPCADSDASESLDCEHQDCQDCDEVCCVAVGVALAASRPAAPLPRPCPWAEPAGHAAARRAAVELFRPPLA